MSQEIIKIIRLPNNQVNLVVREDITDEEVVRVLEAVLQIKKRVMKNG